jgi:hypothetical protein
VPGEEGEGAVCLGEEDCPEGTEVAGDGLCRVPCPDYRFCGHGRDCLDGFCGDRVLPPSCLDGADNDGDGWTDLEDPDCFRRDGEDPGGHGGPQCNDGRDNDEDGFVDGDDPDCVDAFSLEAPLPEACRDGVDNDGDGWTDLEDPGCYHDVLLGGPLLGAEGHVIAGFGCNDGEDNDRDGLFDSADDDCRVATQSHEQPLPSSCTDLVDNDGDGWVDVLDPECWGASPGGEAEAASWAFCSNGVDDDGDGRVDAADRDCAYGGDTLEGAPEDATCSDGIDQGQNGWMDALDVTCSLGVAEEPGRGPTDFFECDDWIDNDGDGRVDTHDPECDSAADLSERY